MRKRIIPDQNSPSPWGFYRLKYPFIIYILLFHYNFQVFQVKSKKT